MTMPLPQLAASSGRGPSTISHSGSKTAVAKPVRSAVRVTGGISGMMSCAAGKPAAQASMEARQIRFATSELRAGAMAMDMVET